MASESFFILFECLKVLNYCWIVFDWWILGDESSFINLRKVITGKMMMSENVRFSRFQNEHGNPEKYTRTQWHARPAHVYILLSLLFYFWKSNLYRLTMNKHGFFWTVSGRSSFCGYIKVDLYTHWSHSFDDISLWCVDFVENIFDQCDEMPDLPVVSYRPGTYRNWLGLLCG